VRRLAWAGSAELERLGAETDMLDAGVPRDGIALVEASIAESTRRAHRSDLAHFQARGRRRPADPGSVASYHAGHAETLSVATLVRRLATI